MESIYENIERNKTGGFTCNGKEISVDEYVRILEKENKSLKERLEIEKQGHIQMIDKYKQEKATKEGYVRQVNRLEKENKKLKEDEKYRHSRCMKAERQIQHSLGGDDELIYEEGLYD